MDKINGILILENNDELVRTFFHTLCNQLKTDYS